MASQSCPAATPKSAATNPTLSDGWRELDDLPSEGETVDGLLSSGAVADAEHWEGPPGKELEWGGWAWEADLATLGDRSELVAWRPKRIPDQSADPVDDAAQS